MKKTITFILILIIGINAHAQDAKSRLETYFTKLAKNQGFTGNVLVADKGRVVYEGAFGYADVAGRKLNNPNTLFTIQSITKTFVATAILQLKEQGKLNIEDPVAKYLPEFPYPNITIKHLLSHTSGLPEFYGFYTPFLELHPDTTLTNDDFIHLLRVVNKPLQFEPGTAFAYSNAHFIILAILIKKITGIDHRDYIARYILKPAGMTHTFTQSYYELVKSGKINVAYAYYKPHLYSDNEVRSDTIPYLAKDEAHAKFSGYGDMVSTVGDLLKYDEALYNGTLLKPGTLQEAFTPVKLNNGKNNPAGWGLGWQVNSAGKLVNHGGAMAGMYLSLTRDIEKHQTAIVFSISREALSGPAAINALSVLNGKQLNARKSIAYEYAYQLLTQGPAAAGTFLETAKTDTLNYKLLESEFNAVGYDLTGDSFIYMLPAEHHYTEALQVLKVNTQLFPNSWNTYDSYAEILAKTGNKAEAIDMYKRSLQLNPQNKGGADALKKLEQ